MSRKNTLENNIIFRLNTLTKEKESVRRTLKITAKRLADSYISLEAKVRARTQDLENVNIANRNILEDLQVEKGRLAEANAKDEAMLASIGDGVIITDLHGKITFINNSAENMLGWKNLQIMGKLLFNVIPIENKKGERVSENIRPMAMTLTKIVTDPQLSDFSANVMPETYYYLRKDKTKFPVSMNFSRVILNGRVIGAIEVFRDITREKEIDKAKSEFVSLASHQLKTPPTAIKLLTERILNKNVGELTKKQQEYFDDIRSTNQRMIDLINALLNVSRIDLGAFAIRLSENDMGDLMQSILHDLKLTISKKNLNLKEVHEKKKTMLSIDESLVRMVINNLIINAIHYTPEKGFITVEYKEMNKGQIFGNKLLKEDSFTISIADTGYGIPKHQQDQLFVKFFRADNAREKQPDGTGLGLYIVKSVLENSGGSVWFKSKENKGSTFYVTIPMMGMREKK